jgi:hypothetical protein
MYNKWNNPNDQVKVTDLSLFEKAVLDHSEGKIQAPIVSMEGMKIDYFLYQIHVHHMNLKIMAGGMKMRGMNLKTLKQYYGLTGQSTMACLKDFENMMDAYGIDHKKRSKKAS